MTISIDYGNTNVITVEQEDCTFVSGTFYRLDTDVFRLALKALEAGVDGISFPKTHDHNTEVTVAGQTYSRTVEILSPYSVQFLPDSAWTVELTGSNNNIWDVGGGILVQNQVQVIPTNSAGLVSQPRLDEVWQLMGLDVDNPVVAAGDGKTSKIITLPGFTLTITPTGITREND
jgi:hypothetical protein